MMEPQPPDSPSKTPLAIMDTEHSVAAEENSKKAKTKKHSHGHSHHGHCHSEKDMKDAGIASIAWMVIMGDGMHNFSDGLAIGKAWQNVMSLPCAYTGNNNKNNNQHKWLCECRRINKKM